MNESYTIYDSTTKQVLARGVAYDPQQFATETRIVLVGAEFPDGWLDDGIHTPIPPRPYEFHVLDPVAREWIDPRTDETQWAEVRAQRNKLLADSDWTQMPDAPQANKAAWATYRQALRDITTQSDPFAITWPVAP